MGRPFRVVIGLLLLAVVGILLLRRDQVADPAMVDQIAPWFLVPGVLMIVSAVLPSRARAKPANEAPSFRLWGTGIGMLDYRPVGSGLYEATRWFTVLYVPLIPGPTWVIRPRSGGSRIAGPGVLTTYQFDRVGEKHTPASRIGKTYCLGIIGAVVAFGPAAVVMWLYNRLATDTALLALLVALIPPIAIFWVISNREARIFERAG